MPVLAATLATMIVFFPVIFLNGVSRFLFTALAAAVVLSLAASYLVAMTVVRCSVRSSSSAMKRTRKLTATMFPHSAGSSTSSINISRRCFVNMQTLAVVMVRPVATVAGLMGVFLLSLALYPLLGVSFFPRTDPGQFLINFKAAPGMRIEMTDRYVARVEEEIRQVVPSDELGMIVSNIG